MKRHFRAGLVAFAAWLAAFVVIAAAASVCSSCGDSAVSPAQAAVNCAPVR